MAARPWRGLVPENPGETMAAAGFCAVVWAVVGVFRPRWLTCAARRTPLQWLRAIAIRLLLTAAVRVWVLPWMERNQHAFEQLNDELGRAPTPEEQMARMEQLKTEPR